jgi:hypothetical protein
VHTVDVGKQSIATYARSAVVREKFLLTRLLADELRLYASSLSA